MVVISIIALLSSIVLASIKSAREKAQITKTVSEMKSMQTALELYRSDKGYYPDDRNGVDLYLPDNPGFTYFEDYYDGDIYNGTNLTSLQGFSYVVQDYLVNNKYIAKIPQSPNYPNNCEPYSISCINSGYFLGYSTEVYPSDSSRYYMCGEDIVKNYAIFFYANSKKINLPIYKRVIDGVVEENDIWTDLPGRYTYCLSM